MKNYAWPYWAITGGISFFMLFSAWFSGTHAEAFAAFGFPEYFRIELTLAKIIGAMLLLFPQTPDRVREWIYVGFGICLISAFIAKVATHYPVAQTVETPVVLVLMVLGIWYLDKMKKKYVVVQ